MEPNSPSKLKLSISGVPKCKPSFAYGTGFLVFMLLLFGAYRAYEQYRSHNIAEKSDFTVVVDCGSTGTRVNVYEWMMRGRSNRDLPTLLYSYPGNSTRNSSLKGSCRYHCVQTEPGLDEFVGNASGVRASLEPLIKLAEKWVPRQRHTETPIFVLGTAGLRQLATEDSRKVLDDVETVVKEHSFMYKKSWIRVLSGKEEAYYGWVALNFKLGSLQDSLKSPTSGIVDLGGSSLQVVLETDGSTEDTHMVSLKIGSIQSQILAYSLPAFGMNEAFDRCHELNTGHKNNSSEALSTEYPSLRLVGDPNWEQCKALARAIAMNSSASVLSELEIDKNCLERTSSYVGNGVPNLMALAQHHGQFHALSAFSVVSNMLNLSSRVNITDIWEQGKQLCSRSWADPSSILGNEKYARKRCFQVPYMASLIEHTLCLGDAEVVFGPGDVSWTLGAALIEGELLQPQGSGTFNKLMDLKNIEIIPSPILLFFLLLCLMFIVYCSQMKLPMIGKKGTARVTHLPSYIHPKRSPS